MSSSADQKIEGRPGEATELDLRDQDLNELRTPDGQERSLSHTNSEEFIRLRKLDPELNQLSMTEAQMVSLNTLNVPETQKEDVAASFSEIEERHFKPVDLGNSFQVQQRRSRGGKDLLDHFIDAVIGMISVFLSLGNSKKKKQPRQNRRKF